MAIRTRILPAANSVAAGKTATIEIPNGQRIHAIGLTMGYDAANNTPNKETVGVVGAQIVNDIKVLLNGKVQRIFTLKQLNALNLAKSTGGVGEYGIRTSGTVALTGYREYIKIYFAEPWRKDISQQAAMAWNLHPDDVRSMQVQVDLGAAIASPFLGGFYEVDELQGRLMMNGGIVKVARQTFGAVSNIVENATIQRPASDYLQALYFMATSDGHYAQKVKLTVNGTQYQEEIDYLENRGRLFGWALNPDTNANSTANYLSPRFDIPMDVDDPINHALRLSGVGELTFKATLDAAAAGNLDVLVERGGPPD